MSSESTEALIKQLKQRIALHPEEFEQLKKMAEIYQNVEGGDSQCFLYEPLVWVYGLADHKCSDLQVAQQLGIPHGRVRFWRKVALWILGHGERSEDYYPRKVGNKARDICRVYEEFQKKNKKEEREEKMTKFAEAAKITLAGEKKKETVELTQRLADFYQLSVDNAEIIDGVRVVAGPTGIAMRKGIKGSQVCLQQLQKKGIFTLKEMRRHGRGRQGVYEIKDVTVKIKTTPTPRKKPRREPEEEKFPRLELSDGVLSTVVGWLGDETDRLEKEAKRREKALEKLEEEVEREKEGLSESRERLELVRSAQDFILLFIESPFFQKK